MIVAALWRHLPGPWPVRALIMLAAAAALIWFLFTIGFPCLAQWLTGDNDAV